MARRRTMTVTIYDPVPEDPLENLVSMIEDAAHMYGDDAPLSEVTASYDVTFGDLKAVVALAAGGGSDE